MHDIKKIRKDFQSFKQNLKKRFIDIDVDSISKLDADNRKLIQEKEELEKDKKIISKSKDQGLFEKSKKISDQIEKLSLLQQEIESKIEKV